MKIRELSSLTALIILCGFSASAFQNVFRRINVNTIPSSSPRQQSFDRDFMAPIARPYSTQRNNFNHRNDDAVYGAGRHRRNRRKFANKPRNDFGNSDQNYAYHNNRRKWLRDATDEILEKEPGTLKKGKWHELVSMIKAWSKFSKMDPEAPVVVERLIKRLHDERIAGNEEARVDINIYNSLLDAWCCVGLFATKSNTNQSTGFVISPSTASQRAREILVHLQENYEESIGPSTNIANLPDENTGDGSIYSIKPNEESFSLVFDVVLKVEGVSAARRLLAWMEHVSKSERNDLAKPGIKYYIRILNAYANSRDENAGNLAEGILRHMEKIGETPETVCYNIAIKAWTKGGSLHQRFH